MNVASLLLVVLTGQPAGPPLAQAGEPSLGDPRTRGGARDLIESIASHAALAADRVVVYATP